MSAVLAACSGCQASLTPDDLFCHACGARAVPAAAFSSAQTVGTPDSVAVPLASGLADPIVRGRVLRDTNSGPGLVSVGGRQLAFTLEQHWSGEFAPTVHMVVDVHLDSTGSVARVVAVSESEIAAEKLKELSASVARKLQERGPLLRRYLDLIGIPVVASIGLLMLSWVYLSAISVRIAASFTQSATMFDVLRLLNSGNGLEGLGQLSNGSSGLYGVLCTTAIVAPLVPTFYKHRLAPLAFFAPLLFLVTVVLAVYWKVHAVAGAANEAMSSFGGSDLATAMLNQVMKAISVGLGTYLSVAVALYLAYRGATKLLAGR